MRSDLAPDAPVWVHVTCGAAEEARRIAHALVAERLAACVHLLAPHVAIYRWEGALHEDAEHALLAKTVAARVPAIRERVRALHGHDLPGLVVVALAGGDAAFLGWIRAEAAPPGA